MSRPYHLVVFSLVIGLAFYLVGCLTFPPATKQPIPAPPSLSQTLSYLNPAHYASVPVTNAVQAAPAPSGVISKAPVTVQIRDMATAAIVRRPPVPVTIGFDSDAHHWRIYTGYGPGRWLMTNILYRSNAVFQGSTVVVNLTNFYKPMVIQIDACNSAEIGNAPSAPLYFGFDTNGTVAQIQGQLVAAFVADSNTVYSLSNAPLTVNRWAALAVVSNQTGLVTVPLATQQGRISIQASR